MLTNILLVRYGAGSLPAIVEKGSLIRRGRWLVVEEEIQEPTYHGANHAISINTDFYACNHNSHPSELITDLTKARSISSTKT